MSWRRLVLITLASPHLLEIGLSLHALMWGIGSLLTLGTSLTPAPVAFSPTETMAAWLGVWPAATGLAGLYAVRYRKRYWRMASSVMVAPVWAGLAAMYWTATPPLTGGVVTYALAAFGEIVVWVRVRNRLDRWADDAMTALVKPP